MIGCRDCMALKESIIDTNEYCISPEKPCEVSKENETESTYQYGDIMILR